MKQENGVPVKKLRNLGRLLPWLKPQAKLFLFVIFLVLLINGAELLKP